MKSLSWDYARDYLVRYFTIGRVCQQPVALFSYLAVLWGHTSSMPDSLRSNSEQDAYTYEGESHFVITLALKREGGLCL